MPTSSGLSAPLQLRLPRSSCDAPAWAHALAADAPPSSPAGPSRGSDIAMTTGPYATLLRLEVPGAPAMDSAGLERRTIDAYRRIRRSLENLPHPHPVRFWNFIPNINQQADARRDRYMVFNSGRFAAFDGWLGAAGEFSPDLPAASAVGCTGDRLVIHCLSMRQPGIAVNNPRQVPAFDYSARYGPRPPCFSRATVVNATESDRGPLLLVSGTASIVGERTVHAGDAEAQLIESLDNLRQLLLAGAAQAAAARGEHSAATAALSAFESVRVYHPRPEHASIIAAGCEAAFGSAVPLELVVADLCRPDLLVEIEGIARLAPPVGGRP